MLKFIPVLLCVMLLIATNIYADEVELKVVAQTNLDVDKYLGVWYEVARLPIDNENDCVKGISTAVTRYKNILRLKIQCMTAERVVISEEGIARFSSKANLSKLKLNFSSIWVRWTRYGNMDYWILNTDYNNFAVVGSPDHEHLWIYSRTPRMDVKQLQNLVGLAQNSGYDISNVIYTKSSIE